MGTKYSMIFKVSSLILLIGVFGDEVTTLSGISSGKFIESNPIANQLINNGTWIIIDLIFIFTCISIPYILIRKNNYQYWLFSLIPLLPGLIRLNAFLSNLLLIINV
jgi:hypothetical protein